LPFVSASRFGCDKFVAYRPAGPKAHHLTRARGYALAICESSADTVALAAPIFDFEERPIGALAISGTLTELDETRAHSLSATVIGAARKISHNAGRRSMSISAKGQPETQSNAEVRCVSQIPSLLGEGPLWSPRDEALYGVDILTPAIPRFDVATGKDTETKLGSMVSLVIPKATGGLLIATPNGLMTIDDSGTLTRLSHLEADRPGNRYDDGKCDRMGRLWVGTMDMGAAPTRGNLFKVDPDGSWIKMDTGFTVANGLGWSPDNTRMYFTDSHRKLAFQHDFDFINGTCSCDMTTSALEYHNARGGPGPVTPYEKQIFPAGSNVKAAVRVNNRAENSHHRTRRRERQMCGFRDARRTQAFLSCFGPIRQHFALPRHQMNAAGHRAILKERLGTWHSWTVCAAIKKVI
jgi:hypothetical protein